MGESIETADLVVVGAGWFGLAAAKTYLQVHPESKVILLEAESSVGGVWSNDRLYPGLMSNNMVGTYEYPDFPMDEATWGVKPGDHIPAQVVHDYLTAFAKKFGVFERTKFNTRVESIERGEKGGWLLKTTGDVGSVLGGKLILASGMTSQAFLPTFKGQESFGPLFHSKEFLKNAETLTTSKKVVVLGSTKSAWDAVYMYAISDVEVDWIIRESGRGPCWMAPPYVTPLKRWLEKLVHTRFLTWMSPCVWGDADGYGTIRSYLHGTAIGRFFVDRFWDVLGGDVVALNKYSSHPETAKLQPWMPAFWTASSLSILNYPVDMFEVIKSKGVRVHVADITELQPGMVVLSSGKSIETDALIVSSGWKHAAPFKFIPASLEAELGLPTSSIGIIPRLQAESDFLTARADAEILARFPRLKNQPEGNKKYTPLTATDSEDCTEDKLTPLDLYRFIVPANANIFTTHDLAFAGNVMTISTSLLAQTQALWITAYFDGKISPLSGASSEIEIAEQVTELKYSARLHNRFGFWRYPHGWGGKIPDFVFDAVPYIDLLLSDLGIEIHRKGGWFKEATDPYGPEDYVGVVGEWIAKGKRT